MDDGWATFGWRAGAGLEIGRKGMLATEVGKVLGDVFFRTKTFFSELPQEENLSRPLAYATAMGGVQLGSLLLGKWIANWHLTWTLLALWCTLGYFFGLFVFPLVFLWLARYYRGQGSYRASLRLVCYLSVLNFFNLLLIPICAWLLRLWPKSAPITHLPRPAMLVAALLFVLGWLTLFYWFEAFQTGTTRTFGLSDEKASFVGEGLLTVMGIVYFLFYHLIKWLDSLLIAHG